MMKILSIFTRIVLFLVSTSFAKENTLPLYEIQRIQTQGMDYDPKLIGKFHTKIFNKMIEKYKENPGASFDVLLTSKDIFMDYCPLHDVEQMILCIRTVSKHMDKTQQDGDRGLYYIDTDLRSILPYNMMDQLNYAIENNKNKQDTLDTIQMLQEELELHSMDEMHHKLGKTLLSLVAESFSLWHDVYTNESRPFRLLHRKLQAPCALSMLSEGAQELNPPFNITTILFFHFLFAILFSEEYAELREESCAPSTNPISFTSNLTPIPSSSPSSFKSRTPSKEHSVNPSSTPTQTFSPTFSIPTFNKKVTCVAIIDESYETNARFIYDQWVKFRLAYEDRPFCLLQPGIFTKFTDVETYEYDEFVEEGDALHVPAIYYNDDNTHFHFVNRDVGFSSSASDWFDLCDLEGLRSKGIGRVAIFIDDSGSMTHETISASFELFQRRIDAEGLEIIDAVYNGVEDWIEPFLTDFDFDGVDTVDDEQLFV